MKKFLFILSLGIVIFLPLSVSAVGLRGQGGALDNLGQVNEHTGLEQDLPTTLGTIISTALSLVGTIFLALMIYAGILWMTAQGKEEKVEKAKDIIIAAIIGLAVTMSAYAITYFVTARLTGVGGGGADQVDAPPADNGGGNDGGDAPAQVCCDQCEGIACDNNRVDEGTCAQGEAGCPEGNTCNEVDDSQCD